MKLKEIMTKSVETIDAESTVQEAARRMRAADVGMLPVLDDGRLVGVITDRDLVVRALSEANSSMKVQEAMSTHTICMEQNHDIDEAIQKMAVHHVGRIVVRDELDRVVGVVSSADVAVACCGDARIGRLAATLGQAHRHVGPPAKA